MTNLPVGVIGTGHLGSLHAKMFADLPGVTLAGVCDIDRSHAEAAAHASGCPVFARAEELFPHVRAVSIAVPTAAHWDVASRALNAGIHVFVEKPITRTVEEAAKLVALARDRNLVVQVGHIERFNPAILALGDADLRPMFVESHRLAQFNPRGTDVAVVLDLMIHDIDIILSLVRSPVERIEANGVPVVSPEIDIANARLTFKSGCVANVTASRISLKKMRKMRLFQRDAYIAIDFLEGSAEVFRLAGAAASAPAAGMVLGNVGPEGKQVVYERPAVKEVNALRHELGLFVKSVTAGAPVVVTAEEGMEALQVAHAIIEKIQQQKLAL